MMSWLETNAERIWQMWAYLSSGRLLAIVVGIGFALLAVFLLAASRTRWGQSKPLTICIVLSILAHVWLLMYALGNRTVLPQGDLRGRAEGLMMAFEPMPDAEDLALDSQSQDPPSWEQPIPLEDLPVPSELLQSAELSWEEPTRALTEISVTPLPPLPSPEDLIDSLQSEPETPHTASTDAEILPEVIEPSVSEQTAEPSASAFTSHERNPSEPILPPELNQRTLLPEDYQLRQMRNRLEIIRAYGADEDTEAAVERGLKWLAQSQSTDGSWNAARFGGGTETRALGEYRFNTGDRADTGVSGLALLAFLSAGHTHLVGEYQSVVARGLGYLLREQMPSGDLSGQKLLGHEPSVVNSRMYCHSIALLALAEAHAMTGDAALREALMKAAQYTINAQDVRGGGWRYHPGEPGDLSLFGWKAMALTSVSRSGIDVPSIVHRRMNQFLDSCAVRGGGLARYRPGEGAPSPTMTAEALACRLLMGYSLSSSARMEATEMMMNNLPGTQPDNVYYWYYATLALFQLQDANWHRWNLALKSRLLETQQPAYRSEAGSWDPDSNWGGYGGRVYSTAMSCLCLEVYYRYLPMYR